MGIEWLMLDFGAISIVVPFSSLRGSISIHIHPENEGSLPYDWR